MNTRRMKVDSTIIRNELDNLIIETQEYDKNAIPQRLLAYLEKWKWGSYGWVSPASLMYTATWRKYYYPDMDCCKIWSADENNKAIPGGYSIRTEDENISIPILAKHDLCAGFCSPNSGMQGSRAIEKMRSLKRLDKDFDNAQRTVFDLKLFAAIMNEINDLEHEQLLEVLKYFICTAKDIKAKRDKTNQSLTADFAVSFDLLDALSSIHDPELTKCVVAACLQAIFSGYGFEVAGVEDSKTAADARAGKPGDLVIEKAGKTVVAIEVKDKTQSIDWNNIERAKRIINKHPELDTFMFVLENRNSATNSTINEMVKSPQLATKDGKIITIVSLYTLYYIAKPIVSDLVLIKLTSSFIAKAPSIKPETKALWLEKIK